MLISLMDRFGLQTGSEGNSKPGTNGFDERGRTTGDIVKVAATGSTWSSTINTNALATTNGVVCAGGSIDLSTLVANNGGGSLSFYTTQANAQAGTSPLGSSTVSPASATNYYVRSTITSSNTTCFSTKETIVTLKPLECGAITITGSN
jgi:hypothetical protein